MLKRLMLILAATASMAATSAVLAADLKIGFVDQERITRESAPAERASKQMEKEFAPRAKETAVPRSRNSGGCHWIFSECSVNSVRI